MKKFILLVSCLVATLALNAQNKVYSTYDGDKSFDSFHKHASKAYAPVHRLWNEPHTLETALQNIAKQEKDGEMTPLFTHRATEGDVIIRITYVPKSNKTSMHILYLMDNNRVGWAIYPDLNGYTGDRVTSKKSKYEVVVFHGNVNIAKRHPNGELLLIMVCSFASDVDKDGKNVPLIKPDMTRTASSLWKKEY